MISVFEKLRNLKKKFININFLDNVNEVISEDAEKENELKREKSVSKDKFLSVKFRKQMRDLMNELNSCEVHFIRCIKTNEEKKKNYFIPFLALNQIRYLGIMESIKIRKDSYPIRRLYKNFYEKYGELDDELSKNSFLQYCDQKADFMLMTQKFI